VRWCRRGRLQAHLRQQTDKFALAAAWPWSAEQLSDGGLAMQRLSSCFPGTEALRSRRVKCSNFFATQIRSTPVALWQLEQY